MKNILMLVASLTFLWGCAAKKPVVIQETAKEEVVVEVAQNVEEQTVMLEDIAPMLAQEEKVVEEVVIRDAEFYTVNPGDNLYKLCVQKNMYIWQLAELNGIKDPSVISIGQELKLPVEKKKVVSQGDFYKVDIGDNLSGIANEVDKSQDELLNLNDLPNKNLIRAGSLLRVN